MAQIPKGSKGPGPDISYQLLGAEAPPSLGRDSLLSLLEAAIDPVILVLSVWWTSVHLRGRLTLLDLTISIVIFALTFPGKHRLAKRLGSMVSEVLVSWYWTVLILWAGCYAAAYLTVFPSAVVLAWLLVIPVVSVLVHMGLRVIAPVLVHLQGPPLRAVIVGMNEQGVFLASRITQSPYSRIELAGFFDDRDLDRLEASGDYRLIGHISELAEYVRTQQVQLIYLSIPMASQPRILQILDDLKDTTASIFFVPDMFVTDLIQGRSGVVCGVPVISVCETPFAGIAAVAKRLLDIVLAICILILIAPIMLMFAVAVKWTSPGPIIFKQRRYGLDGKQILVYKFRSMTVTEDGAQVQQARKNDNRITPLGAFMRKTSIDELPQFVNVLQGRMSIVGPRPHAVAHNEQYRKLIKGYMVRHKVRPGITGWAQVNGFRGETDSLDKMEGRIRYDLDYLRNWSIALDLYIVYRTVRLVLKDDKAY